MLYKTPEMAVIDLQSDSPIMEISSYPIEGVSSFEGDVIYE